MPPKKQPKKKPSAAELQAVVNAMSRLLPPDKVKKIKQTAVKKVVTTEAKHMARQNKAQISQVTPRQRRILAPGVDEPITRSMPPYARKMRGVRHRRGLDDD